MHCFTWLSIVQSLNRKVQSMQNAAARLLTGARRGEHISPVLRQLHWLPVQRRVDFKLACFVFSSLSGKAPPYLTDDIHLVSEVLDAGFARLPTDRALFHAHTTHLATGALLLPGHVSGTACQHTCTTKTFLTTVSGVNLRRRIGFNVASGAQCDILLNCAIEIFLLN